MAIAKGKNEMQASIDDTASALVQLTNELENYYTNRALALDKHIMDLRRENPREAPEVLHCMESPTHCIKDIYDEMHRETMEMLVCRVYSFVEKHMEEFLKRIPLSKTQAKKSLTGKDVSDIVKFYSAINARFKLSIQSISDIWKGYDEFHILRKDIEHHYDYDYQPKDIPISYILTNIKQATELLLFIEENTRINPSF